VSVGVNVTESGWMPAMGAVPPAGAYTNVPGTLAVAFNFVELMVVP
jgi:hypothetical protein